MKRFTSSKVNLKVCRNFVLLAFVSLLLLSATLRNSFITQAVNSDSIVSFPQAGKFYTLAGRTFLWQIIDGEKVTTEYNEEIHKWSIQDVVGDVALVNRTYVDSYKRPQTGENYTDTYDFDYEIAINRTILSAYLKTMSFDTIGFLGSSAEPLDMDVGEHTWGWFSTDLHIGSYVLVSWTWDRNFLGDTLYEIVGEEVIQVIGQKQDCWLLHMPPAVTVDGTQGREETYWVDKDTGIPLKLYNKGWALDGSFGWEGEGVLVNTNFDLEAESTETPSPTYTLTVPTTPGFPETGKFWSWYILDEGWNMRGLSNVSYYQEGLLTRWVANVINDEALVYKIYWGDYLCDVDDVKELEAVDILYTVYRANITTREILEAISSLIYHVNMTSLTYEIIDRTAMLAGDVGEETYCWLPTNIHIGAKVNITWSYDRPWTLDNATYTVIDEKILNALEKTQACWVLYLPPTASIDGTWNYSETWYSDKDTGIPLCLFSKGWAVDGSSAWVDNCWLIDTNVDLGPCTYYLTITSTAGGTTSPLPGTHNYTEGSLLNVTAVPYNGFSFAHWLLDGIKTTQNPITIIMNTNHTLEAYFIDNIKPEISELWQDPPANNVQPLQNVTVRVNVTDYETGIKNVTLWYSIDNGTSWIILNMTALPIPSDTWITYEATIKGYENCTWVTYKIIAYDKAGNNATKDNNGYGYQYHVIPEFPTTSILILLTLTTLITTTLWKTKRKRQTP